MYTVTILESRCGFIEIRHQESYKDLEKAVNDIYNNMSILVTCWTITFNNNRRCIIGKVDTCNALCWPVVLWWDGNIEPGRALMDCYMTKYDNTISVHNEHKGYFMTND